jgi:hypothetical protein
MLNPTQYLSAAMPLSSFAMALRIPELGRFVKHLEGWPRLDEKRKKS